MNIDMTFHNIQEQQEQVDRGHVIRLHENNFIPLRSENQHRVSVQMFEEVKLEAYQTRNLQTNIYKIDIYQIRVGTTKKYTHTCSREYMHITHILTDTNYARIKRIQTNVVIDIPNSTAFSVAMVVLLSPKPDSCVCLSCLLSFVGFRV